MASEAEKRIQKLLGERRPATAAAAAGSGYSRSKYGGQPRTRLEFSSRPATAVTAASYKPIARSSYSYGTTNYGGRIGASGAARGTSTFTSTLASRSVASTLASTSTTNADDLLARLREQRAQREARWSSSSAAAGTSVATTHGARKYTPPSSFTSSLGSGSVLSSAATDSKYAYKPSAHVLQLKKATDKLASSPRVNLRSELASGYRTGNSERSATAALAARPKTRTTKYYRETDYGVGYSRGYGRTASSQLGELSPSVATAANPAHPPRTASEMEFVKHAAGFELPFSSPTRSPGASQIAELSLEPVNESLASIAQSPPGPSPNPSPSK